MNATTRDEAPADHIGGSTRRSVGQLATPSPGLLGVMWHYKFIIAAVTLASTVTATILSYTLDDKYQASITLSPVSDDSSGGRLGGLASLATEIGGGSLGISSPGNTQKQEYLATLQSEALTERYIKENDLLPILFESKWDAARHTWKDLSKSEMPTLWKANQFFKRHVRAVTSDSKTSLTTMMIVWKDPTLAAQWANGLVKLTNDYLRAKAIDESERNISYLKDQFSKTNVIGIQSAINSILEDQMKKAMIAQGSQEYALKVIDPAVPPEKRISPLPWLWIPMGFCLGLIVCGVTAYVYRYRPIRLYVNQDDSVR
jgi:uncharacterized protein involved in exopolysaccharide biosynthesis